MAGVLQHLRSSTLDKRPNPASMVDGQVAINYASGAPGMFFKDSNGDLVKVGPVHVGSGAPNAVPASGGTAGNSIGEQWLDTSGGTYVFKIWDGSAWRSEAGEFVNTTGDTMTGALVMPNGTAASPSLAIGASDNGLYSPGTDQVAISTNGTQRLLIEADGDINIDSGGVFYDATNNRLAIGVTSPASTLHIKGGNADTLLLDNGGEQYTLIGWYNNTVVRAQTYYDNTNHKFEHYVPTTNSAVFTWKQGTSERARIDSSGRLLVGTSTSPSAGLGQYARISAVGYTGGATGEGIMTIARGKAATSMVSGDTVGQLSFTDINGNDFAKIVCSADATPGSGDYPGVLTFSVTRDAEASPTEALRITNGGETRMRCVTAANGFIVNHSDTARNVYAFFEGRYSTTDNTGGTGTRSYIVYTSGDVKNVNNSYGAISDIKLKENIVDANSQWDDLKALQVRNYNFKKGQTHTQIGLIAQEVELVSPGLVTESPDRDEEGNDLGTVTKSVNYSVLYMKAVKALQEAMERIETLEGRLTAAGF